MASNFVEWYVQLFDTRKGVPIDDDSGICNVLTAADPAEITIYSDSTGTSASNPLTMTDGVIQFWADSATTSVDLSVLTSNNQSFFLSGVTQSEHRIDVDTEQTEYTMVIPYSVLAASVSVDTGFTIGTASIVHDVWLRATTAASAGALLDVGTSTDPNGFVVEMTVVATGYKVMAELVTAPTVSSSIGQLLLTSSTNSTARKKYVQANSTSGASIVYTCITAAVITGKGYIYIRYTRTPV